MNKKLYLIIIICLVLITVLGCEQNNKYILMEQMSGEWSEGELNPVAIKESQEPLGSDIGLSIIINIEEVDGKTGKLKAKDITFVKEGRPINFAANPTEREYDIIFDYDKTTGLIMSENTKKIGSNEYSTVLEGKISDEGNYLLLKGNLIMSIIENGIAKTPLKANIIAKKTK